MKVSDYPDFADLWANTHEVMAGGTKNFKETTLEMLFEDLEEYDFNDIKAALKQHRKNAKFAPTPNDIIQLINDAYGVHRHLGIEQAWAKALQMMGDEVYSFVVTKEILDAKALAEPVYLSGDKFGASRAFKERYAELIKNNDSLPMWFVSFGDDQQDRIRATNEAKQLNLITKQHADKLKIGLDEPNNGLQPLLDAAQKRLGNGNNVINLSEEVRRRAFSSLHEILNSKTLTLDKSPELLKKRHDKCLRKKHKQAVNGLKKQV